MGNLKEKIQNKTATLGVCGLGYVGLPLAVEKAKAGFKVLGFDVQEAKVNMVNEGKNYIEILKTYYTGVEVEKINNTSN